jgi:stringent starvation protein B
MDKKKPYLIKAIYDWCSNENTTPFLSVRLMGKSIVPIQLLQQKTFLLIKTIFLLKQDLMGWRNICL